MNLTILGSGGCTVIPKPCCNCPVCEEARIKKGVYQRTGPSLFLHDINLLVDTPAEIAWQLNHARISCVDYLIFTHLDPDHMEGFRVVEQITLDFRTWEAYPEKQICLILPEYVYDALKKVRSVYGPMIEFYEQQGFVRCVTFRESTYIGNIKITAVPVDRGSQTVFIYVFENHQNRIVYAPCDIKPFPVTNPAVRNPDLLIIQPGIFEQGLKHDFIYPSDHISRTTLYTFEDTLKLAEQISAARVLFVHLEEYWNRGYEDYIELEKKFPHVRFAYDGLSLSVYRCPEK